MYNFNANQNSLDLSYGQAEKSFQDRLKKKREDSNLTYVELKSSKMSFCSDFGYQLDQDQHTSSDNLNISRIWDDVMEEIEPIGYPDGRYHHNSQEYLDTTTDDNSIHVGPQSSKMNFGYDCDYQFGYDQHMSSDNLDVSQVLDDEMNDTEAIEYEDEEYHHNSQEYEDGTNEQDDSIPTSTSPTSEVYTTEYINHLLDQSVPERLDTKKVADDFHEWRQTNHKLVKLFAKHIIGLTVTTVYKFMNHPRNWDILRNGKYRFIRAHNFFKMNPKMKAEILNFIICKDKQERNAYSDITQQLKFSLDRYVRGVNTKKVTEEIKEWMTSNDITMAQFAEHVLNTPTENAYSFIHNPITTKSKRSRNHLYKRMHNFLKMESQMQNEVWRHDLYKLEKHKTKKPAPAGSPDLTAFSINSRLNRGPQYPLNTTKLIKDLKDWLTDNNICQEEFVEHILNCANAELIDYPKDWGSLRRTRRVYTRIHNFLNFEPEFQRKIWSIDLNTEMVDQTGRNPSRVGDGFIPDAYQNIEVSPNQEYTTDNVSRLVNQPIINTGKVIEGIKNWIENHQIPLENFATRILRYTESSLMKYYFNPQDWRSLNSHGKKLFEKMHIFLNLDPEMQEHICNSLLQSEKPEQTVSTTPSEDTHHLGSAKQETPMKGIDLNDFNADWSPTCDVSAETKSSYQSAATPSTFISATDEINNLLNQPVVDLNPIRIAKNARDWLASSDISHGDFARKLLNLADSTLVWILNNPAKRYHMEERINSFTRMYNFLEMSLERQQEVLAMDLYK